MQTKKFSVKVKGEFREIELMLPTTIEEAIVVIKSLPKKELFHYLECKLKMDARLKLLNEGKPKKEKKRIVLKLEGLSEKMKKALRDEELL